MDFPLGRDEDASDVPAARRRAPCTETADVNEARGVLASCIVSAGLADASRGGEVTTCLGVGGSALVSALTT